MKIEFKKGWFLSKAIDPDKIERLKYKDGPMAFCVGTLLPCSASKNCKHFGPHHCSTFKKHKSKPCPHYPDRNFTCTKLEDSEVGGDFSLEKSI